MKYLTLLFLAFGIQAAFGASLADEASTLGGNKALMKKVRAIEPNNRVRIVQNRIVDRTLRLELGINYGMASGGDPYLNTSNMGGQLEFHINPRWSIGARYYNYNNSFSSEGKRVFEEASLRQSQNLSYQLPQSDFAKDGYVGTLTWYPFYGKLNLADITVAQFDIYAVGGYGQINLASGSTALYTGGGGMGLWLTKYFSTRIEILYQGYQDQVYSEKRSIDQTVITAGIGLLL